MSYIENIKFSPTFTWLEFKMKKGTWISVFLKDIAAGQQVKYLYKYHYKYE